MKKLLALLFVGAGLTAMAGAPQFNKATVTKSAKGQKVMVTNTLSNELTAPVMSQKLGNKAPSSMRFINSMRPSIANNKIARKGAPRRLSNEDITSAKYLDFRYVWDFNEAGTGLDWSYYHFRGGEGVYIEEDGGVLYCAGMYWDDDPLSPSFGSSRYLELDIDYTTGVVTLPTGYALVDSLITGTYSTSTGYRVDKEIYRMLVDGNYYLGDATEPGDVLGTLYPDGSIEFNDSVPYVYAGYNIQKYYTRTGNAWTGYTFTLDHADTTYVQDIYVGTQFIVPNATQDYDYLNNGAVAGHITDSVYMFQSDYTTVNVFNMCGDGMPSAVINISADGKAVYPLDWPLSEAGNYLRKLYTDNYQGYDFSAMHYGRPYAMDASYNVTEDTVVIGTVTPEVLTLPGIHSELGPVYLSTDTEHTTGYALVSNLINHEFKFMDGSKFVLEEPVTYLRGDVNNDGKVNIGDVTDLISALLTGVFDDAENFSSDNADCDLDGEYKIGDVTTLIAYLLSGTWPGE